LNKKELRNQSFTKIFGFTKLYPYFVFHKTLFAYARRLHLDFCGHCGSGSGNLSDCLAYIPQKQLTPSPGISGAFILLCFVQNCLAKPLTPDFWGWFMN